MLLTLPEIEKCYADGRGMEEFARRVEAAVLAKVHPLSDLEVYSSNDQFALAIKEGNNVVVAMKVPPYSIEAFRRWWNAQGQGYKPL